MEGRLRKRSLRTSESNCFSAEPLRKKPRKQESPLEITCTPQEKSREKAKKNKVNKKGTEHSPSIKKRSDKNSSVEYSGKRSLLVSLNILDNDLQVPKIEKPVSSALKSKSKGAIQRSESVEVGSDFGSTVSSTGNGATSKPVLNFKNPNFTVSSYLTHSIYSEPLGEQL